MQYCELSEGPSGYRGGMWCDDHNLPANHCGPDGDSPVCIVYAILEGCNDCPNGAENGKHKDWLEEVPLYDASGILIGKVLAVQCERRFVAIKTTLDYVLMPVNVVFTKTS